LQMKGTLQASSTSVRLGFLAFPGDTYAIQGSADLVQWQTLGTATADADGVIAFEEPASAGNPARYYRVVAP
jgi:hypothetical protein